MLLIEFSVISIIAFALYFLAYCSKDHAYFLYGSLFFLIVGLMILTGSLQFSHGFVEHYNYTVINNTTVVDTKVITPTVIDISGYLKQILGFIYLFLGLIGIYRTIE